MSADGGSYLIHDNRVDLVFFFYFLCHIICIFFAVAMTDKDGMADLGIMLRPGSYILTAYNPVTGEEKGFNITVKSLIIHKLYQLLKGFFTAADFTDGSEFSVVVYMKDRFNIQHTSYYCSSSGNAASAV